MFLRGIFSKSSLNIMSVHTLEGLAVLDKANDVPNFVYEYLYESASYLSRQNYVAGVGNYVNVSKEYERMRKFRDFGEKVKHKEYNLHTSEDGQESYSCTIPEVLVDGDATLVEKPVVSWFVKMRENSGEAIDFRYELEDIIERFNLARRYLLETYAIDLKRMLYLVFQGRVGTKEYLNKVLEREQDIDLMEVLVYLIKFIEFEDYLASDEEVLVVGM